MAETVVKYAQSVAVTVALYKLYGVFQERRKRATQRIIADKCKERGISVGIIGAGAGGLATAKKCIDLGIPFHIYEMAEDFGGTWFYNRCKRFERHVPRRETDISS